MGRQQSDQRADRWWSFVSITAVVYLLFSLTPLLWILWHSGGWIATEATVFTTTIDGRLHEAVAFTYRGATGSILLWVELLCVSAALVVSFGGRPWARRVAHVLLLVWAGLLFLNAWWFVLASGLQMLRGAIVVVTLGTIAVIARAVAARPHLDPSGVAAGSSSSGFAEDPGS